MIKDAIGNGIAEIFDILTGGQGRVMAAIGWISIVGGCGLAYSAAQSLPPDPHPYVDTTDLKERNFVPSNLVDPGYKVKINPIETEHMLEEMSADRAFEALKKLSEQDLTEPNNPKFKPPKDKLQLNNNKPFEWASLVTYMPMYAK
jgi:hypothetical protein